VSVADFIMLLAAFATLVAFGYGLTNLLAGDTPLYRTERAGVAYILGTGVASMAWLLAAPLYGVIPAVVAVSTVAWTVAAAGFIRRIEQIRPSADGPRRWWMAPAAALVLIQIVALAYAAMRSDLGFDALFNFELRARLAFESDTRGQIPLAFFADESRAWAHPRYPLLVPFAEFWIYAWLGRVDQHLVKVLFPLFYVALACTLGGAVRRLTNTGTALLAVAALGSLPPLTVIPGAISGYAEVPLASAIVAATACALAGLKSGSRHAFWLAGALAAVAAWTKVEGIILAVCLGVAISIIAGRRAAPLILLPLAVVVPWGVFQQVWGMPETDFPSLSPLVALANVERVPAIVRLTARELITPGHWGLLWPSVALLVVAGLAYRTLRDVHAVLASVVIVPVCIYAASYLFSSWTDIEGHVRTSFVRLLVPLAPIAIIFVAAQLSRSRADTAAA
jgi:hypothetical protein